MRLKKLSPVLYVEQIEPCLEFWKRFGFEVTAEVPQGDQLGFVILAKDGIEVMYQSRESVAEDIPALGSAPMRGSFLFIEVDDLDTIDRAVADSERVVPRRQTFYGSDEVILREPAGNVVTFAKMPQ